MNLDIYYTTWRGKTGIVDMSYIYEQHKGRTILLVETQLEHDFLSAMQLIYGGQIEIQFNRKHLLSHWTKLYEHVFSTFDPKDRNRL